MGLKDFTWFGVILLIMKCIIEFENIWQNMIFFEVTTYLLNEIKSFLTLQFQAKF